jgi:Fur family ferric uptake transcriptional regulator
MNIENLIKNKNIRLTTARKALLEIFIKANKPLSYDDIKAHITMDKATFYRNISKFEDEELLDSFESNDKKRYFELKQNPHAHFVCVSCNKLECIDNLNISLAGYLVNNVIINGKCKLCNNV